MHTILFTGAEFVRFTVHARSFRRDSVQLLNTPIISLANLSALEDRHGLVSIDCGNEVRCLIPMQTHPLWQRHRNRFPREREHQPNAADSDASVLGLAVFYATWMLLMGVIMYPYAIIIFMAWMQMRHVPPSAPLFVSCMAAVAACLLRCGKKAFFTNHARRER